MKKTIALVALLLACSAHAQSQPDQKPPTLRSILLEELKDTHAEKDWFVPANVAVAGLTPEQANWKDGKGNHSVGQLAYHLVYWNARNLEKFKGEPLVKFSGNNDETFDNFDSKKWNETVQQLDEVMTEWEKAVETADEQKLAEWAPTIAKISMHNAYHIGQIIYVRKEQGSWNPANGVN
ncbi:MAG TPA: DinB family protein [Pseudacidobacterium sp.]|jgi:uncharacterized damage-inducible protein DinB|nr:DinB family protein [Pseudacidobacterium sp.]